LLIRVGPDGRAMVESSPKAVAGVTPGRVVLRVAHSPRIFLWPPPVKRAQRKCNVANPASFPLSSGLGVRV
jgi:hypothetical protein